MLFFFYLSGIRNRIYVSKKCYKYSGYKHFSHILYELLVEWRLRLGELSVGRLQLDGPMTCKGGWVQLDAEGGEPNVVA